MVDLSIIYSKTGKGLRARNATLTALSTKQLQVLSFIDGKSKAEAILTQSNEITEKELAATLSQLEADGFIRPLAKVQSNAEDWALTSNFSPMVVEEFKNIDDIEAETKEKAKKEKQEDERIATEMAKEKIRWKAEISARKEAEAKEKADAAARGKARLEQERIAREAALAQKKKGEEQKKRDEEIRAKAKRQAELEEQAKLKAQAEAERKTQEEADKRARAEAKENARNELERINREAAEAQKKAAEVQKKTEAEAKLKAAEDARLEAERIANAENEAQLEAARKAKAEQKAQQEAAQAKIQAEQERLETERLKKAEEAQLEAERIAKAENEAHLEAIRKAKAELIAQEAAELERTKLAEKEKTNAEAKEAARLEMARVVRKAEEERKLAETTAKEARQEAKRQIKAEEQARIKAARIAKDDEKQARINAEAAEKNKISQQESIQFEMNRLGYEAEDAKKIADETKNNVEAINQAEQASPIGDNVANKIAKQQAELRADEERQAAIQLENAAEQEKQLAAQQALEKAEQIRAKNEADEKAASDAKELAKQEMSRIAREADALRSQADNPTLTKPTKSGRFEASRSAKLKKSTVQSQKSRVWQTTQDSDTIDAERKAKKTTTIPARKAANEVYTEEKQTNSAAKYQESSSEKPAPKRSSFDLGSILSKSAKLLTKLVKTTLVYGFLLALLLIGIMHFINISPLIAPIEKLAADSFGMPVHIEQVRASLWPQPQLVLGSVTIGDTLKATSVQVIPDSLTLFDDVKRVQSLTIEGLVIEQSNVEESLQAIQHIGKSPSLKVEQINVADLSLKFEDLVLGPFDGKLALNEAHELNYVDLHSVDNTLTAQIKPQGADYAVTLTGTKWAFPFNPNIVFDELKANAIIHQNLMTFSQIDGAIFGGNINAKAVLDWTSDWHATGSFALTNANAPQLLKAFASKASIDGKANLTGDFASQSTEALKLTNTPTITANIELKNGKINGVDLEQAVMAHQNTSLAGRATDFDKLSANLHVKDGQYYYKQIALDTAQFHANGNVEIAQNQAISGRVNAAINAQSRRLQANFGLGGTLDNVKRQ
jgi:AsmA-like C-terminal region